MKGFLAFITLVLVTFPSMPSLAGDMELPPYEGSPALKAMKGLAGTWKGTHVMQGKELPAAVEYKVSSNGSSVVETLFPGTPQEMITVYHDKAGKLAMTHYCSVGNQPHLDMVNMDRNVLSFSLSSANSPAIEQEGHMHDLKITIADADHLKQEWTYYEKGNPGGTTTFTLVRAH